MKKRALCFMLTILVCLASFSTAFAADLDENIQPDYPEPYVGLLSATITFSIDSGGNASSFCIVSLISGYSATATINLQQSQNGRWADVAFWSESGIINITMTKTYCVTSGHNYRAILKVTVFDSDGHNVDTLSVTSPTVYF